MFGVSNLKYMAVQKQPKMHYNQIFQNFAFMTDGGSHFNSAGVWKFCKEWGTKPHIVTSYSPWVNGLIEGTNMLLLYILARLCTPDLEEDHWTSTTWEKLLKTWPDGPDHLDEVIHILNWRILLALKFSPKELLLRLVVNIPCTPLTGQVTFNKGHLMQIYLTYTFKAERKLLPRWSQPYHIRYRLWTHINWKHSMV